MITSAIILLAVTTFNLSTSIQFMVALGLILLGLGYGFSQLRKGSIQASSDSFDIANKEIELLKGRNERMENEIKVMKNQAKEEAERYSREIGRLNGVVEQLQRERDELRKLVMGEKVPEALQTYLNNLAKATEIGITSATKEILFDRNVRFDSIDKNLAEILRVLQENK